MPTGQTSVKGDCHSARRPIPIMCAAANQIQSEVVKPQPSHAIPFPNGVAVDREGWGFYRPEPQVSSGS
jgi:hypothetical protein